MVTRSRGYAASVSFEFAAPLHDCAPASGSHEPKVTQVHLDTQAFPTVVINDVKGPKVAGIGQPIMQEVHGPHLVDLPGHGQQLWLVRLQTAFRLDPEVQLQFSVSAAQPACDYRDSPPHRAGTENTVQISKCG